MTVVVETRGEGAVFGVKALPGSRRNAVCGEHDGCLKVAVSKPPEKGKANDAILEVVCRALALPRRRVSIVAGETGARKKLLVTEITAAELAERLATALAAGS